jgi:glycerophosphoryl diester phosphodiesterase
MTANRVLVYGHRGARAVHPENTLTGFQYAITSGVDGFECDLHVTTDNVIVISHAPFLHGPICQGPAESAIIRKSTLDQLKLWECGGANPAFPRQQSVPNSRIPTLDEVFALASRGDFQFLLEAKSTPRHLTEEKARRVLRNGLSAEITKEQEDRLIREMMLPGLEMTPPLDDFAQMILDRIRAHHLEHRIDFLSADYRLIHSMRKLAPEIRLTAPYVSNTKMMDVIKETGADVVSPVFTKVTAEEVRAAHKAGVKVIPFGNETADWEAYIAANVDGIVSDDPVAVIGFLKGKGLR